MLNWPGFLKWSLSHQDKTEDTKIPKMTQEQQKWLEQVIKESSMDQNKELKATLDQMVEITSQIQKEEDKQKEENLSILMENLRELLSNLDAGINFTKMGGVIFLLDKACVKKLPLSFRYECLSILMEIAQNNDFVQKMLLNHRFTRLVGLLMENPSDCKMQYRVVGALKAIIGGKNVVMKRMLLESQVFGVKAQIPCMQMIVHRLRTKADDKTIKRGLMLLEDLYRYRPYMVKKMDAVPNENIKAEIFPDHKEFLKIKKRYLPMDIQAIELTKKIINKNFENLNAFEKNDLGFKLNFFYFLRSFLKNVEKNEQTKDRLSELGVMLKRVFNMIIQSGNNIDSELKNLIFESIKISKTIN